MSLTRRHFVHVASFSLLAHAAVAQKGPVFRDDPFNDENQDALEGVSAATFEPYVGERFTMSLPLHPSHALTLISVEKINPALNTEKPRMNSHTPEAASQSSICFALHFQGWGVAQPQGTYTVKHPALGGMAMLLVPSDLKANPPTYTAIFNLLES
jgi:hypothetical protein